MGASEQHLDGRKLLIKSSSDYSGRPAPSAVVLPSDLPASALIDPSSTPSSFSASADQPARPKVLEGPQGQTLNRTARKILDRQRNPAGPTLFLGNLGFETKVEDIRMMFDAHQRAAAAWAPRVKGEKKDKDGEEGEKGEKIEVDEDSDEEMEKDESEDESDEEEEKDDSTDAGSGSDSDSDDSDDEEEPNKDSDADSDAEEEAPKPKRIRSKKKKAEEKVPKVKAPLDLSKAKDAGIRKIRLGTFEDTGKCKG